MRDPRPKPFSALLGAVLVGAVGLLAAATRGVRTGGLALVALAGTALSVRGVRIATAGTDRPTNREWALASVALSLGALLAVVPVFRLAPAAAMLVYPFVLAAGFAGVGSTPALVGEGMARIRGVCWRSRDVFAFAAVVSSLVYTGVLQSGAVAAAAVGAALVTHSVLVSLVVLEGLVVALLVVLPRAQRVLDEELATPETRRVAGISVDGRRIDRVLPAVRRRLRGYWWVFAVQLVPAVLAPGLLEVALARVPVFGPAVGAVLTSGALHLVVGGLAAAAAVVIVTAELWRLVVSRTDVDPPRALASATGGVVLSAAVLVPGHLLAGSTSAVLFGGTELARTASAYGPAALVLVALAAVALVVPVALVFATLPAATTRLAADRSSAFLVAAVLGLAGSVAAGTEGVPAVVVFAGVAASLLTWELGHQASYLGVQVGRAVQTRQPEVVHATAAVAVAVAGVGLATLAEFLVVPVDLSGGADRASVAVVLALVSTLSFVLALHYRPSD